MNAKMKNIVLTGFRATGKTSVGRALAAQLKWSFLDTDVLLCQRLGAPIAEIVARHGWPYFRQAESQLLRELAALEATVVATGGGAIEHRHEWQTLRECCFVVWLDADMATIRQRLGDDPHSAQQRPSLTGQAIQEEVEALLQKRKPLYSAGSDLRLDTVGNSPERLAEAIRSAMNETSARDEWLDPTQPLSESKGKHGFGS
jgi:shikimate kinase